MAGNFGVEKGHHKVFAAINEQVLLPGEHDAGHVLADCFSCRTQLIDLAA